MTEDDVHSFGESLERHIVSSGLDLSVLSEQSGVRFPLVGRTEGVALDWEELCYLCFWVHMRTGGLPDEFVSRMVLGPPSKWSSMFFRTYKL